MDAHVPGAGHSRGGGVPPDHLLAPGGRPADHGREHRARHAGLGSHGPRDDRPAGERRLRDPRSRQVAGVHRDGRGPRRPDRAPPPADRALPHRRLRHPVGPGARGGGAARALDVARGRGAHAQGHRRRQDLSARASDLRGRARARRAPGRRGGGRHRHRPALRERGRGPAALPDGQRAAAGSRGHALVQGGRGGDRRRRRADVGHAQRGRDGLGHRGSLASAAHRPSRTSWCWAGTATAAKSGPVLAKRGRRGGVRAGRSRAAWRTAPRTAR